MPYTFKNVIDMTLDRIDEDIVAPDAVALRVVKEGINQGYTLLSTTIEKNTKVFTYSYARSVKLPSDFVGVVEVNNGTPLSDNEYEVVGDLLFIRNRQIRSGNINLTYVHFPARLVVDGDVLAIKDGFVHALTSYGAYVYQLYKRKYSAAQLLLAEYQSFVGGGGGSIDA